MTIDFERAAFIQQLRGGKATADADFADAVYTAVTKFGLSLTDVRDVFGLSEGATERWMQRQNLPQPMMRGKILSWMADNLQLPLPPGEGLGEGIPDI